MTAPNLDLAALKAIDAILAMDAELTEVKAEAKRLREALEWVVTCIDANMSAKGIQDGARAALEHK